MLRNALVYKFQIPPHTHKSLGLSRLSSEPFGFGSLYGQQRLFVVVVVVVVAVVDDDDDHGDDLCWSRRKERVSERSQVRCVETRLKQSTFLARLLAWNRKKTEGLWLK